MDGANENREKLMGMQEWIDTFNERGEMEQTKTAQTALAKARREME